MGDYYSDIENLLINIELIIRQSDLWQQVPPAISAFESTYPFCLDTLSPLEWLQWVFLPKMHRLLAEKLTLPTNVALLPYFEERQLELGKSGVLLIDVLKQLDEQFAIFAIHRQ